MILIFFASIALIVAALAMIRSLGSGSVKFMNGAAVVLLIVIWLFVLTIRA